MLICIALFFDPDLVVITITPLLALLPYNAAAEGPFKTVIEAISSGLRFEIPSGCVVPPVSISGFPSVDPLLNGTPSTTYKG